MNKYFNGFMGLPPNYEIPIFRRLYMEYEHPITVNPYPDILSNSYRQARDFKHLLETTFGFGTPKLQRLIGPRLVAAFEVQEYDQDLPQPSPLGKVRRRIVHVYGKPEVVVGHESRIEHWQPSYSLASLAAKKKEYHIDHSIFVKGILAKDILTLDHMHMMIENHVPVLGWTLSAEQIGIVKEFLKYLHPNKALKVLCSDDASITRNLIDTVQQYADNKDKGLEIPRDWDNLKQLHDEISKQVRIIKAKASSKPIAYKEEIKVLDGYKITNRLTMVLPKETLKLVEWGAELHNCIASYDYKVQNGTSIVVGIAKDGKLAYAMEIADNSVAKPDALHAGQWGESVPQTNERFQLVQLVENCNARLKNEEDKHYINTAVNLWKKGELPLDKPLGIQETEEMQSDIRG